MDRSEATRPSKPIRQLPPDVINKIAAGEVIERPASVVKELLENAVDSGATRIEVLVEKGGSELIRVADNGCGIAADQLELALASHATSKICSADDLFQVDTLGFRGEALASIAEVAQLKLRSRVSDSQAGAELDVYGGRRSPVAPCGCPVGTSLEVRSLFFNTPVRRKFLKTPQTEMGHIGEAFTRVALSYPDLYFSLEHNGRSIHDLPPVNRWRERISALFGGELGDGLMWVENEDSGVRVSGYVAEPTYSRGNNRLQYLFLNGRHIRDRSLQHALTEAYRGLLLTGRYPIVFLKMEVPADEVDVNVHPTKLEVRFQNGNRLYSQLLGTLRHKFLTTDLTAQVGRGAGPPVAGDTMKLEAETRVGAQQERLDLRYDRRQLDDVDPFKPFGQSPAIPSSSVPSPPLASTAPPPRTDRAPEERPHEAGSAELPAGRYGIQLHNRYLVTQNEAGMVVIDQHALHERILYEQLREKVLSGKLETQRLLVPEPVTLSASEAATVLGHRETLRQLGIEIEPFGGDTILVSTYPAMLANLDPGEMLRQVVEQLEAGPKSPDRRDLVDELLHMISCKAAIKAGDRLSSEEVSALLEQRHLFQDTHHCPHGRPTALVFTREELDRRFLRT